MGCNANFMGNNLKGVPYLVVIAKVCHSHSFHLVWWHCSLVEDDLRPVPHGAMDLPRVYIKLHILKGILVLILASVHILDVFLSNLLPSHLQNPILLLLWHKLGTDICKLRPEC